MRTTTRPKTLASLLALTVALVVALAALPVLAQPTPHRPLHPKSEDGLMPPVYMLDPNEPVVQSMATGASFLGAPINAALGGWAQVLAATDLTGDGVAEATVGTGQYFDAANDRQAHVFSWNGSAFSRLQMHPTGADPESAQVIDMNLDGRADLAMALPGSSQLAIYTQTTTPTTPLHNPLVLAQVGAPDALASGDFDGDLHNDLAVIASQSGVIRIWKSTPTGPKLSNLSLNYPSSAYNALAAGDMNNDGEDDLVALHGSGDAYRGREVTVFPQLHGAFAPSFTRPVSAGLYLAQSAAIGDLNGDGLDDLVVTAGGNVPNTYLNVFLQGASGLPNTPTTYSTYHIPSAVAVGDINHDGLDDVVMVHDGWRTLSVFLQNTGHTLDTPLLVDIPYSSRFRPSALAVADFNGDGGLDVGLVGKEAGLTVLLNTVPAPTATITAPEEATVLPPGTVVVSGTASAGATRVQVRLRGSSDWVDAQLSGGQWHTTLALPTTNRPWWIDARAIDDTTGRYQAPAAHRRIRVERFAYAIADNDGVSGSPDRLVAVSSSTARTTLIGSTGTQHIEAIAFKPNTPTLYATNSGQLGTLDLKDSTFIPTTQPIGKGKGKLGAITLNDVDGLAFHPSSGALYAVHYRSRSGEKDLLFQIDPATGARMVDGFGPGVDYVVLDGKNLPPNVNDIAFDPVSATLYGAANNDNHTAGVLVSIEPTTGAMTKIGAFGVDDMEGLSFTGDGELYGVTGDIGAATKNALYQIDLSTGKATRIGALAGQRDYEGLAFPGDGVTLPSPAGNATLPHIQSVEINRAAESTSERAVALEAQASMPIDGQVRQMLFTEYTFDSATASWKGVGGDAAWLPYTATPMHYAWNLNAPAGITYIQGWAADGSGHVSRTPYQTAINYVPQTDEVAAGSTRIYRYTLQAGDQVTVHSDSLTGDADLYVWSRDPDASPWVSNLRSAADEVNFIAPSDGVYQIEVHGATAASYHLTVAITPASLASSTSSGGIDAAKAQPDQPMIPVDSVPPVPQTVPIDPVIYRSVFLPAIWR